MDILQYLETSCGLVEWRNSRHVRWSDCHVNGDAWKLCCCVSFSSTFPLLHHSSNSTMKSTASYSFRHHICISAFQISIPLTISPHIFPSSLIYPILYQTHHFIPTESFVPISLTNSFTPHFLPITSLHYVPIFQISFKPILPHLCIAMHGHTKRFYQAISPPLLLIPTIHAPMAILQCPLNLIPPYP